MFVPVPLPCGKNNRLAEPYPTGRRCINELPMEDNTCSDMVRYGTVA